MKVSPGFPEKSISTSVIRTLKTNSSRGPMWHQLGNKLGKTVIGTGQPPVALGYKIIHKILQKLLANLESLKSKKCLWQDSFPWKQSASTELLFLQNI